MEVRSRHTVDTVKKNFKGASLQKLENWRSSGRRLASTVWDWSWTDRNHRTQKWRVEMPGSDMLGDTPPPVPPPMEHYEDYISCYSATNHHEVFESRTDHLSCIRMRCKVDPCHCSSYSNSKSACKYYHSPPPESSQLQGDFLSRLQLS